MVAEGSEIEGERYSPRRVEPVAILQVPQQLALGRVDVDEPQARAGGLKRITRKMHEIYQEPSGFVCR